MEERSRSAAISDFLGFSFYLESPPFSPFTLVRLLIRDFLQEVEKRTERRGEGPWSMTLDRELGLNAIGIGGDLERVQNSLIRGAMHYTGCVHVSLRG